jgi:hypothetical protein
MYYSIDGTGNFTSAALELTERFDSTNSGEYSISLPPVSRSGLFKFYFTARDSEKEAKAPFYAPDRFFMLNPETRKVELY